MKSLIVKDLMVPLSEYATVSDKATLYEAITTLEKVHEFDQSHYRHRAILVFDDQDRVIGKLGLFDMLRALEAKYSRIGDLERFAGLSLNPEFIKSISEHYSFWSEPLEELSKNASEQKVSDIMHILTADEYIEDSARLDEAIHQLIMGYHQSLIVTEGEAIVGILKLSDIFREVCLMMRSNKSKEA
jgi:CBS domain-containing protein